MSTASNSRYHERRAQGLCGMCGQPSPKKARCVECKQRELTKKKETYEQRKAVGMCVTCRQPSRPGRVLCEACDKKSTGSKRRYYRNKEAGVCRYCGAESGGAAKCSSCKEKETGFKKQLYQRRKEAGQCVFCSELARPGKTTCEPCSRKINERFLVRYRKNREKVINAYGGPRCVRCGHDDKDVLQIDHIDGGGTKHLRDIGQSGLISWLIKNKFPPGFQVLCANCNFKKGLTEDSGGTPKDGSVCLSAKKNTKS